MAAAGGTAMRLTERGLVENGVCSRCGASHPSQAYHSNSSCPWMQPVVGMLVLYCPECWELEEVKAWAQLLT